MGSECDKKDVNAGAWVNLVVGATGGNQVQGSSGQQPQWSKPNGFVEMSAVSHLRAAAQGSYYVIQYVNLWSDWNILVKRQGPFRLSLRWRVKLGCGEVYNRICQLFTYSITSILSAQTHQICTFCYPVDIKWKFQQLYERHRYLKFQFFDRRIVVPLIYLFRNMVGGKMTKH